VTTPAQRLGGPPAIVASIVVWWLLVILPGLLTVAGVFGSLDANTTLGGGLVGLWIGLYCAQLAMIYVVGHFVKHTRAWWFFVASLLPWVVDWASAASIGTGLIAIAVAGVFASLMVLFALRTEALDTRGILVDATVVKVLRNYMNVVINNVYIRRRALLKYTLPDGTEEQKVLGILTEIGDHVSAGEHLKIRVDPGNPRHISLDVSETSQ
jgi:hypothetical protein